jgi:hypothetical protein
MAVGAENWPIRRPGSRPAVCGELGGQCREYPASDAVGFQKVGTPGFQNLSPRGLLIGPRGQGASDSYLMSSLIMRGGNVEISRPREVSKGRRAAERSAGPAFPRHAAQRGAAGGSFPIRGLSRGR